MMNKLNLFPSKKGMDQIWWIIIGAVLAIIVVTILLVIFKGGTDRAVKPLEEQITSFGDCDGDGVAGILDKCPCDASVKDEYTATKPNADSCNKCDTFTCVEKKVVK